jgi:predicted nucleic acid-binding Zn ribbon protein
MPALTLHSHCNHCGEAMPYAKFGQRFCSPECRAEGKADEQRAAFRLWRDMGRPKDQRPQTAEKHDAPERKKLDLVALGLRRSTNLKIRRIS